MSKLTKAIQLTGLLIFQVALTIVVSVSVVYMTGSKELGEIIIAGEIKVDYADVFNSQEGIDKAIQDIFQRSLITVKFGTELSYDIKLSEVAQLDYPAMIAHAQALLNDDSMKTFLRGSLFIKSRNVPLKVKLDKQKLAIQIEPFWELINTLCVNARLEIRDGQISKYPHIYGREVNVESALQWIADGIQKEGKQIVVLREGIDVFIFTPDICDNDIALIDSIIAEYNMDKKEGQDVSYLHLAAKAIDGVLVRKGETCSFINCLVKHECDVLDSQGINSFNQVASTLYTALLFSGINKGDIERAQSMEVPKFTSPGLEAIIEYGKRDLKFKNSFGSNVAILSEITNDAIKVFIVGNSKLCNTIEVIPETIERFLPGNVTTTNGATPYGVVKVINPGSDGLRVRVNRHIQKKDKIMKEIISDNIYEAIDRVIEAGTYSDIPK